VISAIVSLLLLFVAYCFFSNGESTPAWICVGLIVLVWVLHSESVQTNKAWVRRRDYWAKGGPDGVNATHREHVYRQHTVYMVDPEEERRRIRAEVEAEVRKEEIVRRAKANEAYRKAYKEEYLRQLGKRRTVRRENEPESEMTRLFGTNNLRG